MKLITIVQKYDMFAVHHERLAGSRLLWVADRKMEIWVKGPLSGALYEKCANLAMNIAERHGVKPSELRRSGGTPYKLVRSSDTKRMF